MAARVASEPYSSGGGAAMVDDRHDNRALRSLFEARYSAMIALARLLVGDLESAEDAVQEAFARLSGRLETIQNPDAYLSTMVVNRCRAVIRRRQTVRRYAWRSLTRSASADPGPSVADRQAVTAALRRLPARQRECLVLRYYLDLSEQQIAETLSISPGSVKTHTSRALAGMSHLLGELT
jgi:RNA polymerase sigma-70 factor (sigma-E family)